MIIKPECDVENAEDFGRYYNSTYMETRDGQVLQVSGHHGSNIVLRNPAATDDHDEGAYVMLPWRKVQTDLVYGRPPSSLFKLHDRVFLMHMGNNRQSGRGFKVDYYGYTQLSSRMQVRPSSIGSPADIAVAVYRPEFTPIHLALPDAYNSLKDSMLDQSYSIIAAPRRDGNPTLFRRWEEIGQFKDKGTKLVLNELARFATPHLRDSLKYRGDIDYAVAA
jgi:hypothetical protein